MKPSKRSVTINGHRTSISLEPAFWEALQEVANGREISIPVLISQIDDARISGHGTGLGRGPDSGLSGAIRVFLLNHYRKNDA